MSDRVYVRECRGTVDEVGVRLEQAAVAHQFGVIGVIDLRERMVAKGVAFGPACRVYEVCNPGKAKQVLEQDMTIATALPCRIALYEEGGGVRLAALSPIETLGLFGKPGLQPAAEEVEATVNAIIDQAAGG